MAILDDDFQSYAIGATMPFGPFILDPAAAIAEIVAGNGPTGTDRALQLQGAVTVDPAITGFQASFSEFVAVRKTSDGEILAFSNGSNGSGHTFTLLQVKVEFDSTITALCPVSGQILGNSRDFWFDFHAVNVLQVNVTFSDVVVAGVAIVHIKGEIALNGASVISFDKDTRFPIAQLTNGTSEVNRFQLSTNGAVYGAFTLDTLQPIVTFPHRDPLTAQRDRDRDAAESADVYESWQDSARRWEAAKNTDIQ